MVVLIITLSVSCSVPVCVGSVTSDDALFPNAVDRVDDARVPPRIKESSDAKWPRSLRLSRCVPHVRRSMPLCTDGY